MQADRTEPRARGGSFCSGGVPSFQLKPFRASCAPPFAPLWNGRGVHSLN